MFITEYINYNTEKFLSRWSAENKPYEDEIGPQGENWVHWLEGYDPTQKKKYVNWLITRYLKNDIKRLEDIPARIAPALDLYDRLGRKKKLKPEHTDIGQIKSLEDVIDQYKEQDTSSKKERSKKVEQKMYNDGERHREGGPAVIWADGSKRWYKNGKKHRDQGPAVINADGFEEYYLNGKEVQPF